jgi:hypothetical protein
MSGARSFVKTYSVRSDLSHQNRRTDALVGKLKTSCALMFPSLRASYSL